MFYKPYSVYHATHQLFHSSSAIYLHVIDLCQNVDLIDLDEPKPLENIRRLHAVLAELYEKQTFIRIRKSTGSRWLF